MNHQHRITSKLIETNRPEIDALITFLEQTDFFTAPASSSFHLAHEGGLAEHSWNVYESLVAHKATWCPGVPDDSITICGLLHDLAKIGDYKRGFKNVKQDGEWHKLEAWEKHFDYMPVGHGAKSVILIHKFIALTNSEILALYWHMGPWSEGLVGNWEMSKKYNEAQKISPLVAALHMADMEASKFKEVAHGERQARN